MLFINVLGLSAVKISFVLLSFIWENPSFYNTIPLPLNLDFAYTVAHISKFGATQWAADIGGWWDTYSATNIKSLVTSS